MTKAEKKMGRKVSSEQQITLKCFVRVNHRPALVDVVEWDRTRSLKISRIYDHFIIGKDCKKM